MNRRWSYPAALAALAFWSAPASGQTTGTITRQTAPRRYSESIYWHKAPEDLQIPDSADAKKNLPEPDALRRAITPTDETLTLTPTTPAPTRPPSLPEKPPKSKNWVLPPPIEGQPAAKTKEEEPESGWGWLADDMRDRAQQKVAAEEKQEKEEAAEETTALPSEARRKIKPGKSGAGLLLDNTYEPVPTADLLKEAGKRDVMEMVTVDESEDKEQKGPRKERQAAEGNEALRPDMPSLGDRKFGTDSMWGNERLWDLEKRDTENLLPQTAALLSGAATPGRTKPAPGTTAARFQTALTPPADKPGLLTGSQTPSSAPGDLTGSGTSRRPGDTPPGSRSIFDQPRWERGQYGALPPPQPASSTFDAKPLLHGTDFYRPLGAASPSAPLNPNADSWTEEFR